MSEILKHNETSSNPLPEIAKTRIKCQAGITVILTAFKRIDVLRKQLEAIRSQTAPPNKIVLFQDKIIDDYSVVINDDLLNLFDDVYIADENMGVWGRFDYARRIVDTEYVCIFDDDTIPGRGWLENCCKQMQINEGIYGTIGIILYDQTNYPWSRYCRIGWDRPNEETKEVDFVGHSWFMKTKWLTYMFDGTEEYRKYKYAAEDMTLSFSCLQHGISTYVPPHPKNNTDIWGSMPETAVRLGGSNVALSRTGNNVVMNKAVLHLIYDGWKPLYDRNKDYVKKSQKNEKKNLRKIRARKLKDWIRYKFEMKR